MFYSWFILQSLGILGSAPAALLILSLFGLLLYLLTRCCDRKPRTAHSITSLKVTLSVVTVLCCAAIGLGKFSISSYFFVCWVCFSNFSLSFLKHICFFTQFLSINFDPCSQFSLWFYFFGLNFFFWNVALFGMPFHLFCWKCALHIVAICIFVQFGYLCLCWFVGCAYSLAKFHFLTHTTRNCVQMFEIGNTHSHPQPYTHVCVNRSINGFVYTLIQKKKKIHTLMGKPFKQHTKIQTTTTHFNMKWHGIVW